MNDKITSFIKYQRLNFLQDIIAKLHFKTVCTWLLGETTSLNHVIRIVTKDKVLKCSGVILSQLQL